MLTIRFVLTSILLNFTSWGLSQDSTIIVDSIYTFPNVRYLNAYVMSQSDWTEESKQTFDTIAAILTSNPNKKFTIRHHTDIRGSAEKNMTFSTNELEWIKNQLQERGVDTSQLICLPLGESKPIVPESEINPYRKTDREKFEMLHRKNSRIELEMLDK